MTVADMQAELSQHGFGDIDSSQQLRVINDTLWNIVGRDKWPFREKTIALNFDGISPVPSNLPTDFRQVSYIADTTTGEAVWPERIETIRDRFSTNMTVVQDPAVFFYFIGSQIRFYPIPAASVGRYQLDYIARQPALTLASVDTDILIPIEYHRVIVLGALYKLYLMNDDTENVPLFQSDFENGIGQMREELMRRQYMRPDQIFVTDESDEWDSTPFLP
jgi:hypothetical protein